MAIEVKQLVVKGVIQRETGSEMSNEHLEAGPEVSGIDPQALKQELLAACRRMIEDALRHRRER